MDKIESYQLSHPELLSEETLREIIQNSCIALPVSGNLCKDELVEIFKRIALPMPQRCYDQSRHLGRMLSELRTKNGVPAASHSDTVEFLAGNGHRVDSNPNDSALDIRFASAKNRPKPPMSDEPPSWKKYRSSESNCMGVKENDAKRRIEDSSDQDSRKRQKITWP